MGDPFIRRLHESVQTANRSREVRSIMTLAEEMENREHFAREEGLREGRESGLREGRESGLKEGREAGMKEAQERIALKLKASGMELSEIAEVTGLSEEEIENLQ